MRSVVPAFFVFALVSTLAAALVPSARDPVAVIAWPSEGSSRALRATALAGGRILGTSAGDRIVFARSDEPDFAARLYAAGALVVVRAMKGHCGVPQTLAGTLDL